MPERNRQDSKRKINLTSTLQDAAVPVAVVVTVLMMFIPLHKVVVDVAMVLNLAVSLIILLTVIYTKRASDFTSFPRVTLLVTLFGLAINIASTRLILTHPVVGKYEIGNMPGQSSMVQAFASIVTGNSIVVGFVIFIILIVV